jgi:DNA polymerase-3 subunit beta
MEMKFKDYPILSSAENKNPIKVSTELIKQLIEETAFAVFIQESQSILTEIYLSLTKNKKLIAVATDFHCLSQQTFFNNYGKRF